MNSSYSYGSCATSVDLIFYVIIPKLKHDIVPSFLTIVVYMKHYFNNPVAQS